MVISMKIIIADAKKLKVQQHPLNKQIPLFNDKSQKLLSILKSMNETQLHDLLKISFQQSKQLYKDLKEEKSYAALNLFDGLVYKQLHLDQYNNQQIQYLNHHLLINSPVYGLLRPQDQIEKHRLEISHHPHHINLYDYWHQDIQHYLKDEDMIISLSTKEYEKMIEHPRMITIDFQEVSGDTIKRRATYLKKARGQMLDYLIRHQVRDVEQIKTIIIDDYQYNDQLSTSQHFVFQRQLQMKYIKR